MLKLNKVLQCFKENNFELVNRIDFDNFYFECGNVIISLTTPHSDNDYSYLLRADFKKNFNKWNNCEFETNFKTNEEMLIAISELNKFQLTIQI